MNKQFLRDKYLMIRKEIKEIDKINYDNEIYKKIVNLKEYKESKLILTYVSLKNEVDTIKLIQYTLNIGKEVAVPKCNGNNIVFYNIKSLNELQKGNFGILEPKNKDIVKDFNNSICIIPGVAFDEKNNRLGYGKGYYDRFLQNYKGIKIGLTHKECICDKIDAEINDIKMDKVIFNGGKL